MTLAFYSGFELSVEGGGKRAWKLVTSTHFFMVTAKAASSDMAPAKHRTHLPTRC